MCCVFGHFYVPDEVRPSWGVPTSFTKKLHQIGKKTCGINDCGTGKQKLCCKWDLFFCLLFFEFTEKLHKVCFVRILKQQQKFPTFNANIKARMKREFDLRISTRTSAYLLESVPYFVSMIEESKNTQQEYVHSKREGPKGKNLRKNIVSSSKSSTSTSTSLPSTSSTSTSSTKSQPKTKKRKNTTATQKPQKNKPKHQAQSNKKKTPTIQLAAKKSTSSSSTKNSSASAPQLASAKSRSISSSTSLTSAQQTAQQTTPQTAQQTTPISNKTMAMLDLLCQKIDAFGTRLTKLEKGVNFVNG